MEFVSLHLQNVTHSRSNDNFQTCFTQTTLGVLTTNAKRIFHGLN